MDLSLFANPWEHLRLLSDAPRNEALLELLRRRAPGNRVLEIGCGTGLLSLAAAKLGARKVYAVEPTPLVEVAEQLVRDNGLQGIVEVLRGEVQDLAPRPVDLVFSELLNADPFVEGVLDASAAGAEWLAPRGHLAPSRLRVWAALVREPGSAQEARAARDQVRALASRLDLNLGSLLDALGDAGPYSYVAAAPALASAPALIWDLALGTDEEPEEERVVPLLPLEPGPVGGVVLWFEAQLDEGLVMSNAPGVSGHWGQLVCAWDRELGGRADRPIPIRFSVDEDGLTAGEPA
ncbi:MAG: 50S ribosomal protein L11 methyltransferase [Deltaproteobacteria bacterium]|nr:50S ribosomal protein L11 methyltransferase [Deltaproteobacteria bacterium]